MTQKHLDWLTLVTGPPGTGKSTLAQNLALHSLNRGDRVLWVDADYSFSPVLCPSLTSHVDRLFVHHPHDVDQTLSLCTALIARGTIQLVVIDPLCAIPYRPRRQSCIEGDHNRLLRSLQLACHMRDARAVVISNLWTPRNRKARSLGRLSTLIRAAQHVQTAPLSLNRQLPPRLLPEPRDQRPRC